MIKGGKVPAGAKREAGDDINMGSGRKVEAGTSELMSEVEFQ